MGNLRYLPNRIARRLARLFTSPAPTEPLRAAIQVVLPTEEIHRASRYQFKLYLQNQGSELWHSRGAHRVQIAHQWLDPQGDVISTGDLCRLRSSIPPGHNGHQLLSVLTPPYCGDYTLKITLTRANSCPIDDQGTELSCPVPVTELPWRNCDYIEWYQQADLHKDHWTIVGPETLSEHQMGQKAQLQMLLDLGLTPDAHILEVGCGTGRLAEALLPYLNSSGGYYGCDIGEEAIRFCRCHFEGANFVFERNDPDSLPFADIKVDHVVFFSVLTHTCPEEALKLLTAARQCLNPNGSILADVFHSTLTSCFAGKRNAIEWNQSLFWDTVQKAGLKGEVLEQYCHPWHRFAQRVFVRLRPVG